MVIVTVLRAKNCSAGWAAASALTSTAAIASVRCHNASPLRHMAALRSAVAHTLAGAARRIEKFNDRIRGGVGPLERRGMAGALDQREVRGAGQARDIGVAVGARHHAIRRPPDHRGRHGGAVETPAQDAVVEIRWLESNEGAEAQHLIAPHLLLQVAARAGIEAQSGGGVFG